MDIDRIPLIELRRLLTENSHKESVRQKNMEIRSKLSNSRDIIIDVATERNGNMDMINDERPKFKFDFKPTDFRDYIKSEKGLKSALGRKWKPNLSDIGRFCKMYQPITSNYFKIDEEGKNHPVSVLQ